MSETSEHQGPAVVMEVDLAEPPEKVWRVIQEPAIRDLWLPAADLASPEPETLVPGREASYRIRESAPPFLESLVTFRLVPDAGGGTRLRILHELTDARTLRPANANGPVMRAA